jgi:hypothetical protein
MGIVSDDFVDGPSTNLLADKSQFSTVLLNGVVKISFLFEVPVSVDPTSLILLPLERRVT